MTYETAFAVLNVVMSILCLICTVSDYPYRDWRFVLPVLIAIAELVVIIIQTIQNAGG